MLKKVANDFPASRSANDHSEAFGAAAFKALSTCSPYFGFVVSQRMGWLNRRVHEGDDHIQTYWSDRRSLNWLNLVEAVIKNNNAVSEHIFVQAGFSDRTDASIGSFFKLSYKRQ